MTNARLNVERRRPTVVAGLVGAAWAAFGLLLVGGLVAAVLGLSSGRAYDEAGYVAVEHDSSAAEGLGLFLFLTRVLPWAVATVACASFFRGRPRSTGLLILSIPAWCWNALVVYREVTWPEVRQGWPYDLVLVAPAFVITAGAWLSWTRRRRLLPGADA